MGHESRAFFIIIIFGILGLLLAVIEYMLYANSYLLDLAITETSQLVALQIATIIVALLAGCVLAAVSS